MTDGVSLGAIVHLRSGGPEMTVVALDETSATCAWFSANADTLKKAEFPLAALAPGKTPGFTVVIDSYAKDL